MSRIETRTRVAFRLLAGIFGVLLLVYVVRKAGLAGLFGSISALGWGLGLVIAWGGVSLVTRTWAWRLTLLDEKHQVSFARMFGLRLGSEATGQFGILGQLFGDSLRVAMLSSTIPPATGIASVTLDRALFVLSGAMVSAAGAVAVLTMVPLPLALSVYARLFAFIITGIVLVVAVAVRTRWKVLSGRCATARPGPAFQRVDRTQMVLDSFR